MVTECLSKTLFLLLATTALIKLMDCVRVPTKISKDVAKSVCQLRIIFVKLGVPQEPIRSRYRPPSPLRCGWYSFDNCGKDSPCEYQKYEDCSVHIEEDNVFRKNRIHGGQEAYPYMYPSMVYMRVQVNETTFLRCGAVVIDPLFVLTAAHCTVGRHENDIRLEAGRHNLDYEEKRTKQVVDGVKKINEHPKYNFSHPRRSGNDICVLELYWWTRFSLTEHVSYVGLANQSYNATGVGTLVGWGKRTNNLSGGALQEVNMTIIRDSDCRKFFGYTVSKKDICAYDDGISGCDGDSGGPLFQNISGETRIIGIFSRAALNCSFENLPSVFTEISHYSNWILTFLRNATSLG